jgi:hypothetical protein
MIVNIVCFTPHNNLCSLWFFCFFLQLMGEEGRASSLLSSLLSFMYFIAFVGF